MSDVPETTSGYRLFLTDTATGIRREVAHEAEWEDTDDSATEFMWTEGNYSCDCNRSLFYRGAAGEPEDDRRPCGDERFALTVQSHGGDVVYDEMEDRA